MFEHGHEAELKKKTCDKNFASLDSFKSQQTQRIQRNKFSRVFDFNHVILHNGVQVFRPEYTNKHSFRI